jgi:hypothetical protein
MPPENRLPPAEAPPPEIDEPSEPPRILPHGVHTVPGAISGIRAILENLEALAKHVDAKIAELGKAAR